MWKKAIVPVLFVLSACLGEDGKKVGKPDTFVRYINGGYNDFAQDVKQTRDEGFIILATTQIEEIRGEGQILPQKHKIKLIKMDKYGHIQWKKNYPKYKRPDDEDNSYDSVSYKARSMMLLDENRADGQKGYLIVGDSIHIGGQPQIRVMITDEDGNEKKAVNISDSRYAGLEGVAATIDDDGNYVVLGSIKGSNQPEDMLLTALDSNLKTLWVQTYGAGTTTLINRLFNDESSSALLWGGSVDKNGLSDIRLIKTPPNSKSPEFDLLLGQAGTSEIGGDFCRYGLGFAIIGSSLNQGSGDVFLKGVSNNGTELFSDTTYGNPDYAEGGLSIAATTDGGLILLGFTTNPAVSKGGRDLYLLRVDSFGKIKWSRTLGSRNDDTGVRVLSIDGGFVILGTTLFGGLNTITLIKTDEHGSIN